MPKEQPMPSWKEVLPTVKEAVRKARRWLERCVEGLAVDSDDWWIYPYHIATRLVTGRCDCGKSHCPSQHCLAAWPASGLDLKTFIYRAVLGPAGLKAKSFPKGMLFPLLQKDYGLCAGLAEFKRCPTCGRNYDGDHCPKPCYTRFDPTTTRVVGVDWLFIKGVYLPVRRWRCPSCDNLFPQKSCGEEKKVHYRVKHGQQHDYCPSCHALHPKEGAFVEGIDHRVWRCQVCGESYDQSHCRDEEVVRYHVVHGQEHDLCPLCRGQHPERGTEVWVRAEYVRGQSRPPEHLPPLLEGVAEGLREAVALLDGWRAVLVTLLAEREPAPAGQWSQLVENLFDPDADTPTSGELLRQLRDLGVPDAPETDAAIRMFLKNLRPVAREAIKQALSKRGIDEETIDEWLRATRDLDDEWREEEGYEDDDI